MLHLKHDLPSRAREARPRGELDEQGAMRAAIALAAAAATELWGQSADRPLSQRLQTSPPSSRSAISNFFIRCTSYGVESAERRRSTARSDLPLTLSLCDFGIYFYPLARQRRAPNTISF